MISLARGNEFLTVSIMADERSVVTVLTLRRCLIGTDLRTDDTIFTKAMRDNRTVFLIITHLDFLLVKPDIETKIHDIKVVD